MKFIVQLDSINAVMPKKAHPSDAGFDLVTPEDKTIYPGEVLPVNTYVRIQLEPGYEAQIRSRSGLAMKKQLFVLNSPGTIDSTYTGHIIVLLQNLSDKKVYLNCGDRIAQMVINKLPDVELEQGQIVIETERGEAGFGSTG